MRGLGSIQTAFTILPELNKVKIQNCIFTKRSNRLQEEMLPLCCGSYNKQLPRESNYPQPEKLLLFFSVHQRIYSQDINCLVQLYYIEIYCDRNFGPFLARMGAWFKLLLGVNAADGREHYQQMTIYHRSLLCSEQLKIQLDKNWVIF